METPFVSMIINSKKKHKNVGNIIKQIIEIIEEHKVNVTIDNSFEKELDIFVLSYLKLNKLIDIKRDDIENVDIARDVIDSIITKIETNDFIIPELNKKKIVIEENCKKIYEKNSNIKISMKD